MHNPRMQKGSDSIPLDATGAGTLRLLTPVGNIRRYYRVTVSGGGVFLGTVRVSLWDGAVTDGALIEWQDVLAGGLGSNMHDKPLCDILEGSYLVVQVTGGAANTTAVARYTFEEEIRAAAAWPEFFESVADEDIHDRSTFDLPSQHVIPEP